MSWFSQIVLIGGVVGTAALLIYVRLILPRQVERRSVDKMKAFSTAIELRFPDHKGRSELVTKVTTQIAATLKLSGKERHDLAMAVHLRDIGLCAIPYAMVNGRSSANWTPAQRATYDRHAEVGGAMLDLVPSLQHLSESVRYHHMQHDDFPRVVDGEMFAPSKLAEILNVATAYAWVELKEGVGPARQSIASGSGTIYCPAVADALLQATASSQSGSVQLSRPVL